MKKETIVVSRSLVKLYFWMDIQYSMTFKAIYNTDLIHIIYMPPNVT